VQD
jgi:hypothetical protein